jgi:signal transduction histidine kinase/CheY-like chemotaxis protein
MTPFETPMTAELQSESNTFEWMARLAHLRGLACIIADADLKVIYHDARVLEFAEISGDHFSNGSNLLDIVELMARRGDFGPGDPGVFKTLMKTELFRPLKPSEQNRRGFRLQTPSGRRIKLTRSLCPSGYLLLLCEDETDFVIRKEAMRIALESSRSGYIIYNMEKRRFIAQTKAIQSQLGKLMTEKLINHGITSIAHPSDIPACAKAFRESRKTRKPFTVIFRVLDETATTCWVRATGTPQITENGEITNFIIFYTDVTSQLRIQTELSSARDHAEKALSAKNAFLGRLSHEIRTPMNAVVGIADALIHHNNDPVISPKLEIIQSSADKIIRIVDESLQHTKLQEDKLELNPRFASPADSVRSVCALWEEKAKHNDIALSWAIDPSVPEQIKFDDHRYEQCLNNLLSNAVKFSPGGKIKVVLTTVTKTSGQHLVLAVKDSGIGMSDMQLETLFDAYTQADKTIAQRFGGTGLGMSITKQIIQLMGGKVTARSEVGQGTVVALSLPIQIERRIEDRRHNSQDLVDELIESVQPDQSDYAELRVLVVDDNPTNHIVVQSLLDTLVTSITTANNGKEAIACLETDSFDVVLMDIHMPIMDGIEATLSIRGSNKDYAAVPIIALTADPQYQQKRLCRNIGMDDALGKPFKLNELLNVLDQILSRSELDTAA